MATFTTHNENKKQLKFNSTFRYLDLKGWEMIPPPFLKAMTNALRCEMETQKTMPKITDIKRKIFEQKKTRTTKIKFGDVKEHSGNKIHEKKICFNTKPKEMASCILIEHFPSSIEMLMREGMSKADARKQAYGITNLIMDDPAKWGTQIIGSTHKSLVQEAEFADIPMETVKNDLKKIYKYFRKDTTAILGYKTSFKMPKKHKEMVFNPYKNAWEWTGNWALKAPILRLYIIKVVKDEDFCATLIQTAWRQRRDKKILVLLKGFNKIAKYFAFSTK